MGAATGASEEVEIGEGAISRPVEVVATTAATMTAGEGEVGDAGGTIHAPAAEAVIRYVCCA